MKIVQLRTTLVMTPGGSLKTPWAIRQFLGVALCAVPTIEWSQSEAARQFNRVARTKLDRQNVNRQFKGRRPVSEGLAIFLRMAVRIVVLKRRQSVA